MKNKPDRFWTDEFSGQTFAGFDDYSDPEHPQTWWYDSTGIAEGSTRIPTEDEQAMNDWIHNRS